MILTAHQPAYLPWLGYFAKIARADAFVVHDLSRFDRRGTVNRNRIATANGPQWLTVPVSHTDLRADAVLRDIRIVDDGWATRHWRTIQMAYRRAPYFAAHADFLDSYYRGTYETIAELCAPFTDYCLDVLGLPRPVARTSAMDLPEFDRTTIIPLLSEALDAHTFIAGPQAPNYLEPERIGDRVKVEIFDYRHPVYPQLRPGFVSHLSVLDLLMNCGPDSGRIIRGEM
ncbi:WbqC family protein [Streptomyces marincola]|uniref:WbqC family protein n=1 Tax=Streptomyces marincola TaxID=2878388 RepID=UPI00131AF0F6|nr:WbqC family protein [Streptomyces marincola]